MQFLWCVGGVMTPPYGCEKKSTAPTDWSGVFLLFYCFTMNDDSSAIGTSGVKAGGSGFSIVQIAAVLQNADVWINCVPKFMA